MSTFLLPSAPVRSFEDYLATATGGGGVARAQELGPDATIEELTRAGLRGRGGAGFPTGRKWASIAGQPGTRRFVVCNGAEGEPGTFKDRALLRANPYQLVEGVIIAAFAVGADTAYICVKSSFERERELVTTAIQDFQQAGICRDCEVIVVSGPDEYLFGEEKAMLEVFEGKPPLPRLSPPYESGLFASGPQSGWESTTPVAIRNTGPNPTLVNNVETLSNVPHILVHGADWFRSILGNIEAVALDTAAALEVADPDGAPLATEIYVGICKFIARLDPQPGSPATARSLASVSHRYSEPRQGRRAGRQKDRPVLTPAL